MSDDDLAVVVDPGRVDATLAALRERGVYDSDRSLRPIGDGRDDGDGDADGVAIPVTSVPDGVRYREVVRDVGEPRVRGLEDHLREMGWTDAEIERAPGSWAVLGSVILVDVDGAPRPGELGEALLALHGEADTVLARGGISGESRQPDVETIAGEGDTETVHTEHGTRYAMDLAEVMFSPGNKAERVRMGEVVEPGERVVDMFAGIGYFTLPMARAGADVTAIERNPVAFRYLLENVRLNGVDDRVHPYRADCRDVLERVDARTDVTADRVVMGYYDAHEYLDGALAALDPGGVLHVHEATPEPLVFDRPIERVRTAAGRRDRSTEVLDTRRVKTHSEGVTHVVVDVLVD